MTINNWALLLAGIALEVVSTSLRNASKGSPAGVPGTIAEVLQRGEN